jgi:hypothetical protein
MKVDQPEIPSELEVFTKPSLSGTLNMDANLLKDDSFEGDQLFDTTGCHVTGLPF